MKTSLALAIGFLLLVGATADAQRSERGRRGGQQGGMQKGGAGGGGQQRSNGIQGVGETHHSIGDSGVAWYTTWGTGVAEAKRSNRPIFFMSAATSCSGVPGVF